MFGNKDGKSDDGDGVFGKNRERAVAKRDSHVGQVGVVLAQVAAGATVRADAEKLMLKLATFGEGDRLGRFAFSSEELCGIGRDDAFKAVVDDANNIGVPGPRLRDAAHFLANKGWAKLTTEGPFAPGCDFHEVALTEQGRAHVQDKVGSLAKAKGVMSTEGFEGFPSFLDDPSPVGAAAAATEITQLQTMLSRARVKFSVDHVEHDGVSLIEVAGVTFSFNGDDGKLEGVARATTSTSTSTGPSEKKG